jgi:hypothetical protein
LAGASSQIVSEALVPPPALSGFGHAQHTPKAAPKTLDVVAHPVLPLAFSASSDARPTPRVMPNLSEPADDEVPQSAKRWTLIPVAFGALFLIAGGLILTRQPSGTEQQSTVNASAATPQLPPTVAPLPAPPGKTEPFAFDEQYFQRTPPPLVSSEQQSATNAPASAGANPVAPTPPASTVPPAGRGDVQGPIVNDQKGTLALSSPSAVEIYVADRYLGSTPTTLELPAGTHTIEYRHQDLRKQVTHVIRNNETTAAMITFDWTMQVNARPWAQIFLEGTPRRALGQTPLSDVRVPVGGILVFKNPNFPEKSYRVTGRDKAIQITFP